MRLHEDKEVFAELIENSAEIIGLPQVYVEKDYWVTQALKCLYTAFRTQSLTIKRGYVRGWEVYLYRSDAPKGWVPWKESWVRLGRCLSEGSIITY